MAAMGCAAVSALRRVAARDRPPSDRRAQGVAPEPEVCIGNPSARVRRRAATYAVLRTIRAFRPDPQRARAARACDACRLESVRQGPARAACQARLVTAPARQRLAFAVRADDQRSATVLGAGSGIARLTT